MTEATKTPSPWLTVGEAAQRARCGVKTVYREVQAGRLRAARIGGRRELRLRLEWVDTWLDQTSAMAMRAPTGIEVEDDAIIFVAGRSAGERRTS